MDEIHAGDKILMEFSTFGDRLLGVVIDVREDGCLLVYSPLPKPILKRLKADSKILIRYAHEGILRGFKSKVLNNVESRETIIVVERPNSTFQAEDRAEPRCNCSFPATVIDGNRAAQAVLEDISTSCTRVRFLNGDIPFLEEVGGEVKLTFHPFEVGEGYSVLCTVKNMFLKDYACFAILEFKRSEVDARSKIAGFIEAQVCCGIPRL